MYGSRSVQLEAQNSCEKLSCAHVIDELQYNKAGLNSNMPCKQYKHMAVEYNARLDRLDGSDCLGTAIQNVTTYVEEYVPNFGLYEEQHMNRNSMAKYKKCVQKETELLLGINDVGPDVGTKDIKQAFLNVSVTKNSKFCQHSAWAPTFNEEF